MVSSVLITDAVENLTEGLSGADGQRVMDAYAFAREAYTDRRVRSGQPAIEFSKSLGLILAELNSDAQTRIAGLLAVLPEYNPEAATQSRDTLRCGSRQSCGQCQKAVQIA